jgi:DNA polymerase III subunit delta'
MPLPPLFGHEGVKNRLAGAFASGRLPQALLFEGPRGVGKQRLALWLAQLLECETSTARGGGGGGREPCGQCRSCRLVLSLQHPDVHWFVPLEPSKKTADADKQVDLVAEALAAEMAERREQPLYGPTSGLAGHGIAAVRLVLRRLALTPAMGPRKVFVVGDAERLIAQQGADAAANALLKALEEPPANTVFILTAAEPDALLPTIRSRVVRVRVARLSDSAVTVFAQQVLGITAKSELAQRIRIAEGCPGRLLALQGESGGGGGGAAPEQAARFLEAAGKGPAARYAQALGQMPFQARGGFTAMLDALAARLRTEAQGGGETRKLVEAIARVMDARELAQGNVNPQLLSAVLAEDLAEA